MTDLTWLVAIVFLGLLGGLLADPDFPEKFSRAMEYFADAGIGSFEYLLARTINLLT